MRGKSANIPVIILSIFGFLNLNSNYIDLLLNGKISTEILQFALIFVNVLFIAFLYILILGPIFSGRDIDGRLKVFLNLPAKSRHIKYDDIINFLSSQALGAFLFSFLINSTGVLWQAEGSMVAAIYGALIFLVSLFFIAGSLVKFLWVFSFRSFALYCVASILAVATSFSFLTMGMPS